MFSWLDILFPPRCVQCQKIGHFLCSFCERNFRKNLKIICAEYTIPGLNHCYIGYQDKGHTIARLLYAWKYKRWLKAGVLLQELLAKACLEIISTTTNIVFVPIPLHQDKLKIRGFNQAEDLLNSLKSWFIKSNLLLRKRATITQVGLSRAARQANLLDAFAINEKEMNKIDRDNIIVLVDDIVTTGTTLSECAQVLRKHGFHHIVALVLHRGT